MVVYGDRACVATFIQHVGHSRWLNPSCGKPDSAIRSSGAKGDNPVSSDPLYTQAPLVVAAEPLAPRMIPKDTVLSSYPLRLGRLAYCKDHAKRT